MRVSVGYEFLAREGSVRTARVMEHFGIGFEEGRKVIAEELELPIRAGDVVCFVGESGAGKSSLMREAARRLEGVVDANEVQLRDVALIDQVGESFEEGLELLSSCGLSEARLMLRRPGELSDGERYRLRLAKGLSAAGLSGEEGNWVMADEFTATLDRTLAKVVAFNLQKRARKMRRGVLVATTHEDVLEDLDADVEVRCRLEGIEVIERRGRDHGGGSKKKSAAWREGCRSRPERSGTGRIFLGGITGVMRSDW